MISHDDSHVFHGHGGKYNDVSLQGHIGLGCRQDAGPITREVPWSLASLVWIHWKVIGQHAGLAAWGPVTRLAHAHTPQSLLAKC